MNQQSGYNCKNSPSLLSQNWFSNRKSEIPSTQKKRLREIVLFQYSEQNSCTSLSYQSDNQFLQEFHFTLDKLSPNRVHQANMQRKVISNTPILKQSCEGNRDLQTTGIKQSLDIVSQYQFIQQAKKSADLFFCTVIKSRQYFTIECSVNIHEKISSFQVEPSQQTDNRLLERIKYRIRDKQCCVIQFLVSFKASALSTKENLRKNLLIFGIPYQKNDLQSLAEIIRHKSLENQFSGFNGLQSLIFKKASPQLSIKINHQQLTKLKKPQNLRQLFKKAQNHDNDQSGKINFWEFVKSIPEQTETRKQITTWLVNLI